MVSSPHTGYRFLSLAHASPRRKYRKGGGEMSKSARRAPSIPSMKGWSCIEDAQGTETLREHFALYCSRSRENASSFHPPEATSKPRWSCLSLHCLSCWCSLSRASSPTPLRSFVFDAG